jgi:hypothetical protein
MKIILNNIELTPINVIGGRKNVQGANRDTLTFVFPGDMDMAELDSIFSAFNCESITVEDETGSYIHKGYTVRGELNKTTVCTAAETEEAPAVYEDRINVVMGQRTYAESQLASLTETVDVLVLESLL